MNIDVRAKEQDVTPGETGSYAARPDYREVDNTMPNVTAWAAPGEVAQLVEQPNCKAVGCVKGSTPFFSTQGV